MRKTLTLLWLAGSMLCSAAPDTRFFERYADPETRTQSLKELVPGTNEAFFYTALDHQLSGRKAEFEQTLKEWKTIFGDPPVKDSGDARDLIDALEKRQLLLDYEKNPQASLAGLIRRYDAKFDDTRPDATAEEKLPSRLDPALISEQAFEEAAKKENPKDTYKSYNGPRLARELKDVATFDELKTQWFIDKIQTTTAPGVVPLALQFLTFEHTTVRDLPFLDKLTAAQLAEMMEKRPELRNDGKFCALYLSKLRPGSEVDFRQDIAAHAAHLKKCRDFVITLPSSVSALKAHVLYHYLRLQRELGNFPKEDFLRYLEVKHLRQTRSDTGHLELDLAKAFKTATGCPAVDDDDELLEPLFAHFFALADNIDEFAPFLESYEIDDFKKMHAVAHLLAGHDAKRWGKLIPSDYYQRLLEETRISPAPGSPVVLDADAAVSLPMDLKNTPELLIRIYELDLPHYLQQHREEPSADLELDGLIPHHERRLSFPQDPMVLHREQIALPELSGPGVWLVDFVSGKTSSRALVRKGRLIPFRETTAAGQVVRVFDEKGNPVPGATVQLGRETLAADATGRITIPDSANQPVTSGIVQAGKLAAPIEVDPRAEDIAMEARFVLDREQLLSDQQATLQVRLRLTNHGYGIPLERLKNTTLVLRAQLRGGTTIERVISENLALQPTFSVPFQVPADLKTISFTLTGTVDQPQAGEPLKLTQEQTFIADDRDGNSRYASAFYTSTSGGHRLELRGKNGEPLAHRFLTIGVSRDDYNSGITVQMRTDDQGRIELGPLDGISSIRPQNRELGDLDGYRLNEGRLLTDHLIARVGDEIRIPQHEPGGSLDRDQVSLLEMDGDTALRDHFEKLSFRDGEFIISGLPAGSYRFYNRSQFNSIEVSGGAERDGLLVSSARILPVRPISQPVIASATTADQQLTIQLRHARPTTRVAVIGRRFQNISLSGDETRPFSDPAPLSLTAAFTPCAYQTDREISDELRYILDRRAAKTYPGSLLPRPGILMDRWTEKELSQKSQEGAGGSEGSALGGASSGALIKRLERPDSLSTPSSPQIDCDFLAQPSVVRFDLVPDAQGRIKLPLADFPNSQTLTIFVQDPEVTARLDLPLPPTETPLRDRRLAKPLDPTRDFHVTRSSISLKKGEQATIQNLLDADWRPFATLGDAYQLLYGLRQDERLLEFSFLSHWPDISPEKKLELLASHRCHEFNLFLFRKDRPFFDQYVKPLIAQKLEPEFMDDYLLERDLSRYLRPFEWGKLNAAEKALLSQALPAARERIVRELSLRWLHESPAPESETALFTQTLRGADLASSMELADAAGPEIMDTAFMAGNSGSLSSVDFPTEKLKSIIIPRIDFEDTTLEEAIDFLRQIVSQVDFLETDPSMKGVNIVVHNPAGDSPRIRNLHVRNVPLTVALKYICDQIGFRYKQDAYSVTLAPMMESEEAVVTRTFEVPEQFMEALQPHDDQGSNDPFSNKDELGAALAPKKDLKQLLQAAGITFEAGADASFINGKIIVTNTQTELDRVATLVASVGERASDEGTSGDPYSDDRSRSIIAGVSPGLRSGDQAVSRNNIDAILNTLGAPAPSFPSVTRQWLESGYFKYAGNTDESFIRLNRFWLDLAKWDGQAPFLSPAFNACTSNANEALFCLAMLDLPFKAERSKVTVDATQLKVEAVAPMLLFYKDIRPTNKVAPDSPLLVRQSYQPLAEVMRTVEGRSEENNVTGDFLTGVPYQSTLVITNPTGTQRRIDVLAQIPEGAIPLQDRPVTLSATHNLAPHGVQHLSLSFYFPAAGDFKSYPLHVSEGDTVLARSEARTLHVVATRPAPDAGSWKEIAANGTPEQVLEFLKTAELETFGDSMLPPIELRTGSPGIDLDAIRWRLKDRAFFLQVSRILRDRLAESRTVSLFGLLHNDPESIRELLEPGNDCGKWLDTPLLKITPQSDEVWQNKEFDPLVNARAHAFGDQSRITHSGLAEYYQSFLDNLAWKPALDSTDQLQFTAMLLLQDRVDEALTRFSRIDPATLPGRLSYDYLHAVLLFEQEKPEEARAIAARIHPTLPPGLWKDRFQAVLDQSQEITTLATTGIPPEKDQDSAPALTLAAASDGRLLLRHRGMEKATLRLFSVDLEALFSSEPFSLASSGDVPLPAILPNETREVTFAPGTSETTVDLPANLRQGNLLVAAESGTTKLLKVLDSPALEIRQYPLDRILQVLDSASHRPLAKAYVKVYAQTKSGSVVFHKDGYTDLRGKFDYLSHTGIDPSTISRVAILISHPEKGATTIVYDR